MARFYQTAPPQPFYRRILNLSSNKTPRIRLNSLSDHRPLCNIKKETNRNERKKPGIEGTCFKRNRYISRFVLPVIVSNDKFGVTETFSQRTRTLYAGFVSKSSRSLQKYQRVMQVDDGISTANSAA